MTQAGYSSSSPAPSKVVSLAAAVIVGGLVIAASVVAMAVLTTLARVLQALVVALGVIGGVAVLAVVGAVAHRPRRGAAVNPDGKCPPRRGHCLPPESTVGESSHRGRTAAMPCGITSRRCCCSVVLTRRR